VRDALRATDSPISVAFADPILRAAGLKDDTYGEAERFFEITDGDVFMEQVASVSSTGVFSLSPHEDNVLEFASPTVRGSRLAAAPVGECRVNAVRGEHLTMRGWRVRVGSASLDHCLVRTEMQTPKRHVNAAMRKRLRSADRGRLFHERPRLCRSQSRAGKADSPRGPARSAYVQRIHQFRFANPTSLCSSDLLKVGTACLPLARRPR
jgi:hypothetical protein